MKDAARFVESERVRTKVAALREELGKEDMSKYFNLWQTAKARTEEAEEELKNQVRRNKMMGRYLMAHTRRLRATGEEESQREANALISLLRGNYDGYSFSEVAPVRWVVGENVERNPDYYKVLKTVNSLRPDGTLATWCLITPAKEYPVCPVEDTDDPSI